MSSLREQMERAAEGFRPTRDWLDGAMGRVRRRQRARRVASGLVGLVLFAVSFMVLWTALRPNGGSAPAGAPACSRTWTQISPRQTSGGFAAVSGTAADDLWAVGPGQEHPPAADTIVRHWDGETWERVPSPNAASGPGAANELHGVVAIAPDDAWAVGEYMALSPSDGVLGRVLVEHWDGTSWSIVPAPDPSARENRLNAVAASGPNDVWAVGLASVGTRGTTLIEHWDGRQWSVVPTPDVMSESSGASLDAVSIVSPSDVWAVGSQPSGVLIEHWDGSAWAVVDAPQPADHGFLTDVDASGPDDVWAVGWTSSSGPGIEATPPVVEHYDGNRWEIVELPAAPARFVVPLSVTAVGPQDVWITGWMGDSNSSESYDTYRPLVVHWDGKAWTSVDIGLDQPPQVLTGATKADDAVWFVGHQGGVYDSVNGSLEGGLPLAAFGECTG